MKKNKALSRSSADSTNNQFKALKSFIQQLAPQEQKEIDIRTNNRKRSEDDVTLFFQAIEGVRRIDGDLEKFAVPLKQKSTKKADTNVTDEELFLETMQKIGLKIPEKKAELGSETAETRSTSSRMRKLKRGKIRISRELDLHGFQKVEAIKRLENVIASALWEGHEAILVITGKGLNSPEGPVLHGAVASWLRERGKGMVAEFYPAPRTLGGNGAFVVFLKKKREKQI